MNERFPEKEEFRQEPENPGGTEKQGVRKPEGRKVRFCSIH